jgi:hypothetical protein
LACNIKNIS